MEIRGLAALVTGGSRGLGAQLGRELSRQGARVVLVARGGEDLDRVVRDIRAEGGDAHALPADVGEPASAAAVAGGAAALVGPLDILVHNASTLGPVPLRWLLDTQGADLERVLQVNVLGPFRLTRAIAGSMVLRGRGLILHLTSDASVAAYPGWGPYSVSKAALDHLGRVWARELEGTGVRVLGVDPGEMDTGMHAEAMPDADRASLAAPEAVARRIVDLVLRSEEFESGGRLEIAGWRAGA